jgi:uncharacterized protein (UPF0548 family)
MSHHTTNRALEARLAALSQQFPNYDEVGVTLCGALPTGFRHDDYAIDLGTGDDVFTRAVTGLRTWRAHQCRGVRVLPSEAPVSIDVTVIVALGTKFLSLYAPCRVVAVIDEPDRFAFAYGTLPGHPEQGEESFSVSRSPQGKVTFTIRSFSRPASLLARASGPIGRRVQITSTRRYLAALKKFVSSGSL